MQMQNKRKTKTKQNEETNDRIMNIDNTDVLINNLGVNYYCCCSSAYLIFFGQYFGSLVSLVILLLFGWLVGWWWMMTDKNEKTSFKMKMFWFYKIRLSKNQKNEAIFELKKKSVNLFCFFGAKKKR